MSSAPVCADSGAVDFTLYPGEVVDVTALDGQGQTDFGRRIAGMQELQAGTISLLRDRKGVRIDDIGVELDLYRTCANSRRAAARW